MAQPMNKLFMGKVTEACYQLSTDEQDSLVAKVNEALERVAAKRIVLCSSNAGNRCGGAWFMQRPWFRRFKALRIEARHPLRGRRYSQ
jgi:hypothetical protein